MLAEAGVIFTPGSVMEIEMEMEMEMEGYARIGNANAAPVLRE